ncbi:hypothetical protein CDL15_Pgr004952 [Punica granatum]|uniref:Pentatricopeptide repeat-containing protein n=1 Tax=Punica granatum TaxID=22663 RepID=A0A218WWN9_PUNGR|nr:hypothetical protein CDL15_Pgr004952 [Punica granatum]
MNAHLAIPSPPQALLSTSLPSNCEDPPCPADMIQLEDHSHGLEEESQDDRVRHKGELWDKHSSGQYFLSLKPSLDDPGFDLILLLLGLAAGSSRFVEVRITGSSSSASLTPNSLLDSYEKCGLLQDALHLFDEMPHRDLFSWASALAALNLANRPTQALSLLPSMLAPDALHPNNYVLSCLNRVYAGSCELRIGNSLGKLVILDSSDFGVPSEWEQHECL